MLAFVHRMLGWEPEVRLPRAEPENSIGFFTALDRLQEDVFRRLRRRYREPELEPFCQLVAVKTANAWAADHHFRSRDAALVSRPIQLQVDPTNSCHLHCPGCLHSANPAWGSRFDWPPATLGVPEFAEFCRDFGPFALGIALFRDGEPLLHRRFPEFVKLAKGHLLHTLTSTSLSMRVDAEALVACGLDRLVAGIDGATAATYNRFRRGGDFGLALENLRALVRAREAQSSRKPWLVWQFLAFEHNMHEVAAASRLARQIGIDQFVVARPYSVERDEPGIRAAAKAPWGDTLFREAWNWCGSAERTAVGRNADQIERVFTESWVDRYRAMGGPEAPPRAGNATCRWLYYNLTMDGSRRITPCCLPPMGPPEPRRLVFATFDSTNVGEIVNSRDALLARRQCRSRAGLEPGGEARLPYCVSCTENPSAPMPPDVARYLVSVDERGALPAGIPAAFRGSPLFGHGLEASRR